MNPLDSFSRQLRRVNSYETLIELVREELFERFGLTNAWLYVCEHAGDDANLDLIAAAGPRAPAIRDLVPSIPRKGDALIEALPAFVAGIKFEKSMTRAR